MSDLMMVQENDFFDNQDLTDHLFCDDDEFDSWKVEDIGELSPVEYLFD